jgi:hypothetical protein
LEALRLSRGVAEHDANNPAAQRAYAESLNRVANILLRLGREPRTAEANFVEAARIGERTLAQTPSDADVATQVAASYRGQAEIALRSPGESDRVRAAALLRKSVDSWRAASKRSPLNVEFAAGKQEAEAALDKLK